MDLMYGGGGCGSSRKLSLEEMMEGDLKYSFDDMDLLLQVPSDLSPPGSSKSLEDFMLEDLNSCGDERGDFLFGEEGLEEFGMRFDSTGGRGDEGIDIFDNFVVEERLRVCSNNNNDVATTTKVVATTTSKENSVLNKNNLQQKAVSVSINGKVSKVVVQNGLVRNGTTTTTGTTTKLGVNSNLLVSSATKSGGGGGSGSSIYVWNGISFLNREVSKGISFEESCGIMVDPSSIVPASVSGSAGSSSIGSEETDPEFLATDDESESEVINGSIAAWIVPDTGSRSPTPEYELEEPEYILTTAGSHSLEPPAKKRKQKHEPQPHTDGRIYPKPGFSYSCLIAMSLKNSKTGCLPVSEIYKFMCDHFPYFKTAPSGWKNSVRHNLSLNKCFEKIEKPGNGTRKGCLWALNPAKIHKMDEEVQKWSRKDPMSIRRAMSDPENLELLERGEMKKDYSGNGSDEDEEEEFGDGTTATIITTQAQRQSDQKIHIKKEDPLDFGTITNVRGNYLCAAPSGPQTYTLQFSNLSSTTPIIIRRTPVK
ncbi:uncharacterized protein LOC110853746 isoform X2 [Folsomia candida]|uniref:uncharacterized protein LOC110853746 isoform X2 n=1 Tax=Folsomia candida TaxID=158441 RepID=UPI000B8FC47F|nr:uncharacterized protein LOC110853746 isoform X2 [Folsomia candida]